MEKLTTNINKTKDFEGHKRVIITRNSRKSQQGYVHTGAEYPTDYR